MPSSPCSTQRPPTVLVIGAVAAGAAALAAALSGADMAASVAHDGDEGRLQAEGARPDLILLDLALDGAAQICRGLGLHPRTAEIPVLLLAREADGAARRAGMEAGAADYLVWPGDSGDLLARVRTHLSLRTARRELARQDLRLRREIGARRRAERRFRQSQHLLREAAARGEAVREDERAYLTREIHDELGQYLSALRLGLAMLGARAGGGQAPPREEVRRLVGLVDQTIKVVRNIVAALRPAVLDLGLVPALEWLAGEFVGRTAVPCRISADGDCAELDDRRATAVFRIVQESLTNIGRHAGASRVEVTLRRGATHFLLCIDDDGRGFDPGVRERRSFGLVGIRERAMMLGGEVRVDSVVGAGTVVAVRLPIPPPSDAG